MMLMIAIAFVTVAAMIARLEIPATADMAAHASHEIATIADHRPSSSSILPSRRGKSRINEVATR